MIFIDEDKRPGKTIQIDRHLALGIFYDCFGRLETSSGK